MMQHHKDRVTAETSATGIERELCCAMPRPAACTESVGQNRIWLANLIAIIVAAVIYSRHSSFGAFLAAIVLASVPFAALGLVVCEVIFQNARFYVAHGIAIQATVEECQALGEGDYTIHYSYPASDSKTLRATFQIHAPLAYELRIRDGGLAPGTRFTVLRHPQIPFEVLPYCKVTGVTLPEKIKPQFIPPIGSENMA